MKKPLVGIVGNILVMDGGMFPGIKRDYVNRDYVKSIGLAGGAAVILPVMDEEEIVRTQLEGVDAILLSGGYDLYPQSYGEEPMWEQGFIYQEVDDYYFKVIKAARELGKPVFGICKGIQAINVAFGGTLYQDIKKQVPDSIKHSQSAPRYAGTHQVEICKDSFLGECLPEKLLVNSYHHQAIKEVAEGFSVTARSVDGVIEGIESLKENFIAAVQWHPEMMAAQGNKDMIRLLQNFLRKI